MLANKLKFFPRSLFVSSIFFVLVLCGCSQNQDVDAIYQRAVEYRQAGNLQAAIIEFKNVLLLDEGNAKARLQLGELYLETDNGLRAEKELRIAQKLGDYSEAISLALVRSLLIQKRYEDAITLLDDIGVDSEESNVLRGRSLLGTGHTEEARLLFDKVLNVNPINAEGRLGLVRIALNAKNLVEADKQLSVVLDASPENVDALLMKAALNQLQLNHKQAQTAYESVLKINKSSLQARIGLVETLLAQGDIDTAAQHMKRLTETAPTGNIAVKFLQARVLMRQGDVATAINVLSEVLAAVPTHSASLQMMGYANYKQKNFERSRQVLSSYLEIQPKDLRGLKLLAAVELELNQPARVIEILQPVISQAGKDPQALVLLATALIATGEFEKASNYLEQAALIAPDVKNIRAQQAMSNFAAGVTDVTLNELKEIVDSNPDSIRSALTLVTTYLKQAEYDNAFEAATSLSAKIPKNPVPYYLMALSRQGMGDPAGARAQLEKALEVDRDYAPAALGLAEIDIQEGKVSQARMRYEAILSESKHHPQTLVALAQLEAASGNTSEAITLVKQAQMHNPNAVEPRLILAEYYLRLGKSKASKALVMAKEARSLAPLDQRTQLVLAKAQAMTDDNLGAVLTLNNLLERHPESYEGYFYLALAQEQLGDRVKARLALEKSLELKPDNLVALHAQGNMELADQDTGAALAIARKLQQLHPASVAGYILEGDVQIVRKDSDKAINAYETAMSHGAASPVVLKLFKVMTQAGNHQQASDLLHQWLTKHPRDLTIKMMLADAYRKQGQTRRAIGEFEQILEQQPNNIVILNNLAGLYSQVGDRRALDMAKRAYALGPDHAAILDTYGWLLVENGEASRGRVLLEKAVTQMPDNASIRYHLALAMVDTGDKQLARDELSKILDDEADFAERDEAKSLLQKLQ